MSFTKFENAEPVDIRMHKLAVLQVLMLAPDEAVDLAIKSWQKREVVEVDDTPADKAILKAYNSIRDIMHRVWKQNRDKGTLFFKPRLGRGTQEE